MNSKVLQGNNVDVLKTFPDNHFDSIVTDPPYGIDFLGKAWDANTGALETYQECLRVLKPGGHIVAFSAARTYHHLAVTIEAAGFEIRDQIMWIYSSGFPKSQDIGRSIQRSLGVKEKKARPDLKETGRGLDNFSHNMDGGSKKESGDQVVCTDPEAKAWSGWGTQLKPAHEPIVLARKPIKLSIAKNCQHWGVGALNIDATRVLYNDKKDMPGSNNVGSDGNTFGNFNPEKTDKDLSTEGGWDPNEQGRFPSNVIGDIPDYQKYFYCPKVSRKERHIGYDTSGQTTDPADEPGNNHPTVKPIELMKYLIRLITPAGGRVLDPFNGSGSTGCAAVELDYEYTGIELDAKYVAIAEKRIAAWYEQTHLTGVFEYEH